MIYTDDFEADAYFQGIHKERERILKLIDEKIDSYQKECKGFIVSSRYAKISMLKELKKELEK